MDRTDEDQIVAPMQAQERKDFTRRADAREPVLIRRNDARISETAQSNDEHLSSRGLGRSRYTAWKRAAARKNTKS